MKTQKIFLKKNLKWIIAVVSLILFLILSSLIHNDKLIAFDNFYYKYMSLLISERMTFFVKMVTHLGSALSFILLTVIVMLLPKEKKYGILVGINLIIAFLFNLFLKSIFSRPRPLDINLIKESGYSFPSGHAMVSTAFYGFLIYLIWQTNLKKEQKWLYSILLSVLVLLICITRVYLGVHYASDVLGGMLISIFYLVIFTSIVSKYLLKKKSSK